MSQIAEAFRYDDAPIEAQSVSRSATSISIFADRAAVRASLGDHALELGLVLRQAEPLALLMGSEAVVLGDVVVVDVPVADAQVLAALARLDMRAARSGCQMIVATVAEGLDGVFGCVDQSGAQILVSPSSGDHALALGTALSRLPVGAVHELSGDDRLTLVRLTEQVQMLARQMEALGGPDDLLPGESQQDHRALRSPSLSYRAQDSRPVPSSGEGRKLPSAALVREIIRQRQLRARFFEGELFSDPAWDILLDLTAARVEGAQVSVSSLCIAACVPPTTALRWIGQMEQSGLLDRVRDPVDRRRAFIELSNRAADAMAAYFHRLDNGAAVI